jgi:hypothetical protein
METHCAGRGLRCGAHWVSKYFAEHSSAISGLTLWGWPSMGDTADVLATIDRTGLSLVGHFTLPDEAWWDDIYTPMEQRIAELRAKHAADAEALAVLDRLAQEPEMHRRHSDYYANEFFVARRPT